ncbi:sulfotransferase family protein [Parahaliea aestuarii]|uniref:Sulfotransferase family protein n=1 Tax=Parahaliea aestuarii TaxID=1852021 RepID=A0A5C8ZNX0_9GAMM|nr:hypothetical protein [Parahaliea aestuarii]TXS89420.1 hypothetical protein FVW59_18060 [Parahaliea aestuarii]
MRVEKPIIVVLGSGRSGTSLLMQLLVAMGMRRSDQLVAANESNPEGYFEDAVIVAAHKEILNTHPPGKSRFRGDVVQSSDAVTSEFVQAMVDYVGYQINSKSGIWGFKDPRTVFALPLWRQVFARLKIKPTYLLAVRSPEATVASMRHAYSKQNPAELNWLVRNSLAITETNAEVYITNYDNWFTQNWKSELAKLASHLNFELRQSEYEVAEDLIKPDLNHFRPESDKIADPQLAEFYEKIIARMHHTISTSELLASANRAKAHVESHSHKVGAARIDYA